MDSSDLISPPDQLQILINAISNEISDLPVEQKERIEASLHGIRACVARLALNDGNDQRMPQLQLMQETLAASEIKYQELAESISDPFVIYDTNLRMVFRNKASAEATHVPDDQALGKTFSDLYPELAGGEIQQVYLRALETHQPQKQRIHWARPSDGGDFYYDLSVYPTRQGLIALSKDITDRVRAEMAQREALEQATFMSRFPNENPNPVARVSYDGLILYRNRASAEPSGWGLKSGERLPDPFLSLLDEAKLQGKQMERDVQIGKNIYSIVFVPFPNEQYINLYGLEITERKLWETFKKAQSEIDHAIHSTLDFDEVVKRSISAAAKALDCDTAALSLRKRDRWIISGVYGFPETNLGVELDDHEEKHALLAIQTKKPVPVDDAFNDERFNREHLRKWGIRSVLVMPVIVKDEAIGVIFFNYQRSPVKFKQVHIDFAAHIAASLSSALENARLYQNLEKEVSERKLIEAELRRNNEALRKSEERFAKAFRSSPVGLAITHVSDGQFIDVNDSQYLISGYTRSEIIGHTGTELGLYTNPDERAQLLKILREQGSVRNYEMSVRKKSGEIITLLFSIEPIELEGEACILSTMLDITDRKRAEEARHESEARARARANELEALMDAAPAVIWISRDPECREMIGNRFSYDFLHIRQGENVSKTAPDADVGVQQYHMRKDGRPVPASELPMQIAAATGKPAQDYAFDLVYEDGTVFNMFGSVNPLFDGNGKPYGAIGVFVDLTSLRRLEAEQVQARAELEVQRRLMDQREQERQAIARDLHDGPIQTLSSATFHLQMIKEVFPDQALHVELNQIGMDIRNSIHEIREVLNDLRPPALMHFGFYRTVQLYTEDLRERYPDIEIDLEMMDDNRILPDETRLALFRIYQAAINNIVRHSGATKAWIIFKLEGDSFYLELSDNGSGFEITPDFSQLTRSGHFGLVGMKERAEAIGGEFFVSSGPCEGTSIVVKGPLAGKW